MVRLTAITRLEFNERLMQQLSTIAPGIRHLSSGSNRRHPIFTLTVLRDARQDIELLGIGPAAEKWKHFLGLDYKPGGNQ